MCGCFGRLALIRASARKRRPSASISFESATASVGIVFSATLRLSTVSRASCTTPLPPRPISLTIEYLPKGAGAVLRRVLESPSEAAAGIRGDEPEGGGPLVFGAGFTSEAEGSLEEEGAFAGAEAVTGIGGPPPLP